MSASYFSQVLPPRPQNSPNTLVRLDVISKEWYTVQCDEKLAQSHSEQFPTLNPQVEVFRNAQYVKLQEYMEELLLSRFGIEKGKPVGIFDRWLWTQLNIQNESKDALLPYSARSEDPRFEVELADFNVPKEEAQKALADMASKSRELVEEIHEFARTYDDKPCSIFLEPNPSRKDAVKVCYSGFKLDINQTHLDKLKRLYTNNSSDPFNESEFLEKTFCLLLRYHSLGGDAFQAAVPPFMFKFFQSKFDVQQECFASPLNSFFDKMCSAFKDTDAFFGSVGSFFNFYPEEGSFEANPPFTEVVMQKMAEHIDYLLMRSEKPLSFCVIVPKWSDSASPMWQIMTNSPFLVKQIDIKKREHQFCRGYQHQTQSEHFLWFAYHDTAIFFLQNEDGRKKWPITDDLAAEVESRWALKTKRKVPRQLHTEKYLQQKKQKEDPEKDESKSS